MQPYKKHLVHRDTPTRQALEQLEKLALDAILFVVDEDDRLMGSLTDGDVRRGLISGIDIGEPVTKFIQPDPKFIPKDQYNIADVIRMRDKNLRILPVINQDRVILNIVNFRLLKSYLPIDAVIMAGGRGSRLRPLTDKVPKPLLVVGDKPIIEHNIDRLCKFGVDDFWISVRYLGEQLEQYFGNGAKKGVNIEYIWEDEPLGTLGAVSSVKDWKHDHVLITNSDILTTLDYEEFYLDFVNSEADMAVASIPYTVDIPYAVLETDGNQVNSFREKPSYTYYSNGGIYLVKKELLESIPPGQFYNTTDLMEHVIQSGKKLVSYPLRKYWLDVGKPEDFSRAQEDIKHLNL
jgi:dTDP-glucose pyrophosphorylase